jgi:hypothetical protein
MKDKIGFQIPSHLEETWNEAEKIGREQVRPLPRVINFPFRIRFRIRIDASLCRQY